MNGSPTTPRSIPRVPGALALLAIVLAAVWTSAGCSAVRMARGDSGANTATIQPGVTRAAVEAVLGSPVREWTSSGGIRYRAYEYDTGCPPTLSGAGAMLLFALVTAGWSEVFEAVHRYKTGQGFVVACHPRTTGRVLIAYDERDVVLGIFGEFDDLPGDGRSEPRKWR